MYNANELDLEVAHNKIGEIRIQQMYSRTNQYKAMCPHCFDVKPQVIKTAANANRFIEITNVDPNTSDPISSKLNDEVFYVDLAPRPIKITCDECGEEVKIIWLDDNIADIVSTFNKKGFTTSYCCEGHPNSLPYIAFKPMMVKDKKGNLYKNESMMKLVEYLGMEEEDTLESSKYYKSPTHYCTNDKELDMWYLTYTDEPEDGDISNTVVLRCNLERLNYYKYTDQVYLNQLREYLEKHE